ncbi:hypothetical protein BDZ91DRAFT_80530 [Kalaharituber pfeilii]|nr:hypothetical protein BDZ91DRAFT_80530 [Kalaharituber pfeilii]
MVKRSTTEPINANEHNKENKSRKRKRDDESTIELEDRLLVNREHQKDDDKRKKVEKGVSLKSDFKEKSKLLKKKEKKEKKERREKEKHKVKKEKKEKDRKERKANKQERVAELHGEGKDDSKSDEKRGMLDKEKKEQQGSSKEQKKKERRQKTKESGQQETEVPMTNTAFHPADREEVSEKNNSNNAQGTQPVVNSRASTRSATSQPVNTNWVQAHLEGGSARKSKFLRLLGAKPAAIINSTTTDVKSIKKREEELERQFNAGVLMSTEPGFKRRCLGA